MGAPRITIRTDSQARHLELTKYLTAFRKAEAHFKGILVRSVPLSKIADTDALTNAGANNEPLPAHVLYEVLHGPVEQDADHDATPAPIMAITTTPDWRGVDERSIPIDLIDEARGQAAQNLDRYVIAIAAWFNTKLAPRSFAPSDMVLRQALNPGKLQNK
ncbi:hypothetical protein E2562_001077 [Oryza meyeriana var. granulata]|uniref:Uncharacterized protein n=1 Tax=Oryza meyeriana var. granulata TaxID=110450 RepID=A0A6G1ED65_9ORYZ|nr:hypothetical protein E2562_001077 [Oryza meyeriana var. granulata]